MGATPLTPLELTKQKGWCVMDKANWEFVTELRGDLNDAETYRMRVDGGWLYWLRDKWYKNDFEGSLATSLAFVPDPKVVAVANCNPESGKGLRVRIKVARPSRHNAKGQQKTP